MKILQLQFRRRGSALITVVMLMAMMAVLTASLLNYTMTEKRGNVRNILQLRAKNMAENITIYAAEQLSTRFYRSKPSAAAPFTGSTALHMPDSSGAKNVLGTSPYAVPGAMELFAGVEAPTAITAITDPADSNYGLYVSTVTVPIIAKGTVTHPVNGTFNAYVLQEMKVSMAPLFQFGMFYNMDMELYPSGAFTAAGPVHTNGNLIAHPDGTAAVPILFTDRVTAAGGVYWTTAMKATPRKSDGLANPPGESSGNVFFTHTNGTTTADLKGSSGTMSNKWMDHKYGQTTETATTVSKFKTNATTVWNGNLRSSAHGVTKLQLPGIGGYSETNLIATPEDDRNNGRQLIEPPNAKKWNVKDFPGVWTEVIDDADAKETKLSWKAGLHIMVNPDASPTPRSGTLPDGSTAYVLPRSYRAWLTSINTGTNLHTCTEVVLPGQPSYGYNNGLDGTAGTSDDYMYRNLLPNRFAITTVAGDGSGNAVLRIPQQPFSSASGYVISYGAGYGASAVASTSLNVAGGTGPILPGQFLTIGSYSYLVTAGFAGGTGTVTIAGGPLAAITDGAAITVRNPISGSGLAIGGGTGYLINKGSGSYPVGTTDLVVDTGTGQIYPGNVITVRSAKYVVASVTASVGTGHTAIRLVSGLLAATVVNDDPVTVNPLDGALGTGTNYYINAPSGKAAGDLILPVDTGLGTILPGDIIAIGSRQYVVADASPTAGPVTAITIAAPGLLDALVDNTPVMVDAFRVSGYSPSTVAPSGDISSGATYPADSIASAPYTYFPADAYFFDTRRATSNRGVISAPTTTALYYRGATGLNYTPRPVAKIDFDMARFRMMIDRTMSAALTSTMYDVRAPTAGAVWANSILNGSGATAAFGLGLGASFNVFPATTDIYTKMRQDPYQMYYAPATPEDATTIDVVTGVAGPSGSANPLSFMVPTSALYDGTAPDAWFDGIAVYLHSVEAEKRVQVSINVPARIDSGVRLWNGRGNVSSISAKPGFTFVTNDALYVMGHFNANGAINSVVSSSTAYGGYSARYPDNSSEKLCALMGDAVIIVSHPTWSDATNGQAYGWNDALSALPVQASSTNWRGAGDGSGVGLHGSDDGVITGANGPKPALLPNRSYPASPGSSAARVVRLKGINTEISSALLCGVVPSNHNPTGLTDGYVESSYELWGTAPFNKRGNGVQSGGANNFPRLMDDWNGNDLYIRGSIVALFESRVAMEPFTNSRNYRAPDRYWGFHEGLRDSTHHIPLEPVLIGCNRNRYTELTPAQYIAKKAAILDLH